MKFLVFLTFFCLTLFGSGFPKEYYEIDDVTQKKEEFIKFILPILEERNREVVKEREFVENFFRDDLLIRFEHSSSKQNIQKLTSLARKYKISNIYNKKEYLNKIDVVPISMALSQAALESGWGDSLYTKKYNNLFGHYTFDGAKDGAIISGKKERIRIFPSISKSIESYALNLNTHWAYQSFRDERERARSQGEPFLGMSAIKHISKYSEIGKSYSTMLKDIIKINNLYIYDKFYVTQKTDHYLLQNGAISSL